MRNPITQFRIIAVAEGISFLVLLGIAMPLKYIAGNPEPVKFAGWAHGILFVLYLIAVFRAAQYGHWSAKGVVGALFASLLPFGPFVFDHSIKREEVLKSVASTSA